MYQKKIHMVIVVVLVLLLVSYLFKFASFITTVSPLAIALVLYIIYKNSSK